MTVLEAIKRSAGFLEKKQVEAPRLNAELLLAHVLKLPRMRLYLEFERALTEADTNQLRELVLRRSRREPLQQITGSTSFLGHEIAVSRDVLIPRPETELLAETALELLGKSHFEPPCSVLDIGTGSGCLAIAIALGFPHAAATALDISPAALACATANVERHQLRDRVKLLRSDFLAALAPADQFHLIVSNPPYIPSAEIETLEPEVRDFEPKGALDGGPDGLDFYRRIAAECGERLEPGGWLALEFGDGQGPALQELFSAQKWIVEPPREDYTRRQRILVARRDEPGAA